MGQMKVQSFNSSVEVLETYFEGACGRKLRPLQRQALDGLCRGRNSLLVWPTGSGKSLCYQLPILSANEGLGLVVSPLIALMEDQVASPWVNPWPVTCLHSKLSRLERDKRLKKVESGEFRLLYLTPERLRQPVVMETLSKLNVRLLAVDEAHCISQWGHDFRPDYLRVGEFRKKLGSPLTMALTATATPDVQNDLARVLGIEEGLHRIVGGFERPELSLSARECEDADEKIPALLEWMEQVKGAKIVYFTLISTLEKQAAFLRSKGVDLLTYHGDLPAAARKTNQSKFQSSADGIMLATPAFGLGVDKSNIRGVLHFETPGSLEAYYQEVGRAGRDGRNSRCLWLYCQHDLATQMRFIETLTPDPDYLRALFKLLVSWRDRLKTLSLDDLREQLSFKNKRDFRLETSLNILDSWDVISYPGRRLDKLEILRDPDVSELSVELWQARRLQLQKKLLNLIEWLRSDRCRQVGILEYFGQKDIKPCGHCDRCVE